MGVSRSTWKCSPGHFASSLDTTLVVLMLSSYTFFYFLQQVIGARSYVLTSGLEHLNKKEQEVTWGQIAHQVNRLLVTLTEWIYLLLRNSGIHVIQWRYIVRQGGDETQSVFTSDLACCYTVGWPPLSFVLLLLEMSQFKDGFEISALV